MISLIKNEYIKIGKYKIFIMFGIFLIIICFIYKFNNRIDALNNSFELIPFIGVTACVLFSGIISLEYTNGNLRYYLTKPIKRSKIYLSKILSIYLYMFLLMIYIIIINLIFIKKIDTAYIFDFILYCFPLLTIGMYIILLSTLFKSTSLVVGINMFTLIFSFLISQILLGYGLNFIEYTTLPYLEFNLFNDKDVIYKINQDLGCNLNIKTGIIIDTFYLIIYYLIGNKLFKIKDIRI